MNDPETQPVSGDAWVYAADGRRMWGRYGAAGLALVDRERGMLLQHRAAWSHFGNTWGIPGGARDRDESPVEAAQRESREELAVPADVADPVATRILDLDFWSYTTLIAHTRYPFEPEITDAESAGAEWVALDALHDRPLHPGFAASLPDLTPVLQHRPVLVVDVANVMGTVADGWWRDRAAAATRLLPQLARLATAGVPADLVGLQLDRIWPQLELVVEGEARAAAADACAQLDEATASRVHIVSAPGHGDDEIVATVERERAAHPGGVVALVSADHELQLRAGATTIVSPAKLRALANTNQ